MTPETDQRLSAVIDKVVRLMQDFQQLGPQLARVPQQVGERKAWAMVEVLMPLTSTGTAWGSLLIVVWHGRGWTSGLESSSGGGRRSRGTAAGSQGTSVVWGGVEAYGGSGCQGVSEGHGGFLLRAGGWRGFRCRKGWQERYVEQARGALKATGATAAPMGGGGLGSVRLEDLRGQEP